MTDVFSNNQLFTQLPPLSLYIHIPWCVSKCPYCDFNSHESNNIPEAEYVAALINDLERELPFVQGRSLTSIFFGGGTPSLFSPQSIASILKAVEQRIPFEHDIEITLEANPGTVEQKKFIGYRAAGVNRLSIGIQSFSDMHLKSLGRIHSGQDAIKAVASAKSAGFNNFNLDLMHGLPHQNQQQALFDLQQAIELKPTHISWYQLTIEANTAFYSRPPILPIEDELADIQDAGEQHLANHGYQQYEISAYSEKSKQCTHNLNYWRFGDYLGIGAGAHGKVTLLEQQIIQRRWKTRSPKDYLQAQDFLAGNRTLSTKELPLEFLMNALRLNQGFSEKLFNDTTGVQFSKIEVLIEKLIHKGLLDKNTQYINTTDLGKRFLNEILSDFEAGLTI
jgi:oxygen-independent coproporphyrinogen-3 oxidase